MPLWLSILSIAVRILVFCYGHRAVLDKLRSVTGGAPEKADPTPAQSTNPDITDHYGGI